MASHVDTAATRRHDNHTKEPPHPTLEEEELAAPPSTATAPPGRRRLTQGWALAADPSAPTAAPPAPTTRDLEDHSHACPGPAVLLTPSLCSNTAVHGALLSGI